MMIDELTHNWIESAVIFTANESHCYGKVGLFGILGTIISKINVNHKGVRLSEKMQLTAALCYEILLQ